MITIIIIARRLFYSQSMYHVALSLLDGLHTRLDCTMSTFPQWPVIDILKKKTNKVMICSLTPSVQMS